VSKLLLVLVAAVADAFTVVLCRSCWLSLGVAVCRCCGCMYVVLLLLLMLLLLLLQLMPLVPGLVPLLLL
jgi:hypothetical protein